jgi:protein-disulfide isomerase
MHTDWAELVVGSDELGSPRSAVDTIVVVTDFYCPACKGWHANVLSALLDVDDHERIAVRIYPWPLPIHPGSDSVAQLFRCAARAGVGVPVLKLLYERQPMSASDAMAHARPLLDSTAQREIEGCSGSAEIRETLIAQASRAEALGARGTPGVAVNGHLFSAPPSIEQVRKLMRSQ